MGFKFNIPRIASDDNDHHPPRLVFLYLLFIFLRCCCCCREQQHEAIFVLFVCLFSTYDSFECVNEMVAVLAVEQGDFCVSFPELIYHNRENNENSNAVSRLLGRVFLTTEKYT